MLSKYLSLLYPFIPIILFIVVGMFFSPTKNDLKDLNPVNRTLRRIDMFFCKNFGFKGIYLTELINFSIHAIMFAAVPIFIHVHAKFPVWIGFVVSFCALMAVAATVRNYILSL